MESGHHCPYLGLKQNRAIRFASPTPEHRCYVTGDAQDIPVPQATFCLDSNHVRCPLYTGENLPSTNVLAIPAPLPQAGVRGWLGGLSGRDRRIYAVLVGLLGLIIATYIVSAFFLFAGDDPTGIGGTATTTISPTTAASTVPATDEPTPTFNLAATAAINRTQTAQALGSQTPTASATVSPSRTPSPSPSASATIIPTIFIFPTDTPIFVPPFEPPTDVPPTAEPPTDAPTAEPPTAEPPTDAPTAEPITALPTITLVPPTDAPTAEPPTAEPPTPLPLGTETPGGSVESVVIFFADPNGRVLVPVTRPIIATRQGRTAALNQLIAGPQAGLARLVPTDTRLLGLLIKNGQATANFNRLPTFGNEALTDLGLRSVVLALTERTDITTVQLQVNGVNSGAPRFRPNVNPDNPTQLDGNFATTSFLPLYFPLAKNGQMTRVIRLVPRTSAEGSATVNQLIAGPGPYSDVLTAPIPSATTLNTLAIKDGVAFLDLGSGFLQAGNRRQAVDSLLLSLSTFASIKQVTISVDGVPLDALWGAEYRGALSRPALNHE